MPNSQFPILIRGRDPFGFRLVRARTFTIQEPKPRRISAAPFRDRVAHHALTRAIEPVFERRFSPRSFACRKGLGLHKALDLASRAARECRFVLKCDVRKFFASMDHAIVKDLLARAIKCAPTLSLAATIIDGSNPQEEVWEYFPGDDLFSPGERRRGLPLGNQTSQFFANVYLNPLDQFIERTLQPAFYARYVDDFVLFGHGKKNLNEMRLAIGDFLCGLRLKIHRSKSRVYTTAEGFTFLGWRIFPDRRRLVRTNVVAFRRRLRGMQEDFQTGQAGWKEITRRVQAWVAHAAHGNTWRLREQIFGQTGFQRRSAV